MSYITDNFDQLSRIIRCIATQFGENCEVVLHDLTQPYDSTIMAIENGHVTHRKVGDSGTNIGLEVLRGTVKDADRFNYVNQTRDGKVLRSSSVYLKDEQGQICGSICINFDITDFIVAGKCISYFSNMMSNEAVVEDFYGSVDGLLDSLIQRAVAESGKTVDEMVKEDKRKIVKILDEKGAFLIKKAGDTIANYLKISKYTVYNYLEEIRGNS